MAKLREYVELADHVYTAWVDAGDPPADWLVTPGMFRDDSAFWNPGSSITSSGLQCRAYKRVRGSEAVIAYKGTKGMASDLAADAALALWAEPRQMKDALTLTEQWVSRLAASGVNKVTLTGHSLGGAIAQYVGSRTQCRFVTFNAPGMLANTSGLCASPWQSQNLTLGKNYIMWGDTVGNYGRHIGDTVRVKKAGIAKVALHAAVAGAMSGGTAAIFGAGKASLGMHGLQNFRDYLNAKDPLFPPDADPLG